MTMTDPEITTLREQPEELTEEDIARLLDRGLGVIHTLHQDHGDKRELWDPEEEAEVESARATFDRLKRAGYMIYRAQGKKGVQGEVMRTFDPKAGRLIAVKANQGG